jgi:hypothetical protein
MLFGVIDDLGHLLEAASAVDPDDAPNDLPYDPLDKRPLILPGRPRRRERRL